MDNNTSLLNLEPFILTPPDTELAGCGGDVLPTLEGCGCGSANGCGSGGDCDCGSENGGGA